MVVLEPTDDAVVGAVLKPSEGVEVGWTDGAVVGAVLGQGSAPTTAPSVGPTTTPSKGLNIAPTIIKSTCYQTFESDDIDQRVNLTADNTLM